MQSRCGLLTLLRDCPKTASNAVTLVFKHDKLVGPRYNLGWSYSFVVYRGLQDCAESKTGWDVRKHLLGAVICVWAMSAASQCTAVPYIQRLCPGTLAINRRTSSLHRQSLQQSRSIHANLQSCQTMPTPSLPKSFVTRSPEWGGIFALMTSGARSDI
ncbi:hypothetical protein BDZ85DRAFT_12228 [Elsinoe ampelina]|uniref:Uncharacterized protein n=1 Tax=Elsinoe ampelina TaxID=302913 RepID=A0A6A6GQX1_9PEZI|nr:hypothetical protein BDZ85DRAFT_12228 [Elsinoe ampelina]